MSEFVVVTFYKFVRLPDFAALRTPLLGVCMRHGVIGTVLLAEEGINSTLAGSRVGIEAVLAYLRADPRLADLEIKESGAQAAPFGRMKVRLKKEIVTLGVPGADPTRVVGEYVAAREWNGLIADPQVLVLDTRNAYETDIGTFAGAVDPRIASFRQFPSYVREHLNPDQHKRVAMFCTGGIRCEKATSFLLSQGFEEVYHLKGGILKYLEEVPVDHSLWRGACFVFDERAALGPGLASIATGSSLVESF